MPTTSAVLAARRAAAPGPARGVWRSTRSPRSRVLRRIYPGRAALSARRKHGRRDRDPRGDRDDERVIAGPEGMPRAEADGVILSAPAVWGRATMDLLPKAALLVAVRLFPDAVLTGRGLGIRISDNDAVLRQMARDPLVIKETRVDAVYGLVDLMDPALAAAPLLDVPLLLMYGAHDEIVPRRPVAEFVAHLPTEPRHPRRLAYYQAGYHLLLRDLGGGIVANDVASWIADPRAPLPSKADAARLGISVAARAGDCTAATNMRCPAPHRYRRRRKRRRTRAGDPSETVALGTRRKSRRRLLRRRPQAGNQHRPRQGPVAQLDRALPSEGRGRRFESFRVRHFFNGYG